MKWAKQTVWLVAILGMFVSSVRATTIFSDDFTGTASSQPTGWYAKHGSAGGTSALLYVDTVLGGTGNTTMSFVGSSGQATMVSNFGGVTLTNTGDYINLSVSFRIEGTPATNDGPLIGLYNSAGTLFTSNALGSFPASLKDDKGYSVLKIGANSTSDVTIRNETNTSDSQALNAAATTTLKTVDSGIGITSGSVHTASLQLERLSDGNLIVTYTLDSFSTTYTTTSVATYTFDEVVLMGNGATTNNPRTNFDNVVITTNVIPEPSTYALLIFGGVAFLLVLRFHQKRIAN